MKILKNSLYSLIDLLTFYKGIARKINGYTILFPAKWSRYFEEDYEKENVEFLTEHCKENMTVIDIGTHLGLMSIIASQLVKLQGKVYSFEPTPDTFASLKNIIHLNHADTIIFPFNQAVSNHQGTTAFYIDDYEGSNANSLVTKNHRNRQAIDIEVISIDAFVSSQQIKTVDIIKIDAEGTELEVLEGAHTTLKKFHPKIILAIHPPLIKNNGQTVESIYDFIAQLDYDIYFRKKILSKDEFCNISDFFDVHLIHK